MTFHIHHHVYLKVEEFSMPDIATLEALVADLKTSVDAVAAKEAAQATEIQALKDQIAALPAPVATQAQLDTLAADLQPIADQLKTLG
jgi:hypothetical protein